MNRSGWIARGCARCAAALESHPGEEKIKTLEAAVSLVHSERDEIGQISAEIAETERLIHQRIETIILRLKMRLDVTDEEKRIGEMRAILEMLRARRKTLLRAKLVPRPADRKPILWKKGSDALSREVQN